MSYLAVNILRIKVLAWDFEVPLNCSSMELKYSCAFSKSNHGSSNGNGYGILNDHERHTHLVIGFKKKPSICPIIQAMLMIPSRVIVSAMEHLQHGFDLRF
nr:hypothetical protein [Tanacetum cinerariifolium]